MNGLCPACRRPYDDANIVFNKPSTDEYVSSSTITTRTLYLTNPQGNGVES